MVPVLELALQQAQLSHPCQPKLALSQPCLGEHQRLDHAKRPFARLATNDGQSQGIHKRLPLLLHAEIMEATKEVYVD